MPIKQHKAYAVAYAIILTFGIALAIPSAAFAEQLPATVNTGNLVCPDYNPDNGYYNTCLKTVTVKNDSGSKASQIVFNDGTVYPNIYVDFVGYSTAGANGYEFGRTNGYDYLYKAFDLCDIGQTCTFNIRVNYHVPINNYQLKAYVDRTFNSQPQNITTWATGGYGVYTQSNAPPEYPKRIISTSQAAQATSNIKQTILDNIWAVLGVLAFGLGLLLLNRYLDGKTNGIVRRV